MSMQIPGGGSAALNDRAGKLPAGLAFGFGIAAAILGTGLDYVFETIGLGGYLWYVATAVLFLGAGFGAAFLTGASKPSAIAAIIVGAVVYAALTLVIGLVVMGGGTLGFMGAMWLALQNFGIGAGVGVAGVYRGARMKEQANGPAVVAA